jgi:tetratricopeptide (TPR) repeat protein
MAEAKKSSIPLWQTIALVLLFLFFLLNFLWPKDKITQTKLNLARWPLSPSKHLQMAELYFNNHNERKAIQEWEKAKKLYQPVSFLDLNHSFEKQLETTAKLVYQPEKIRKQIEEGKMILETKPYCRDVLISLSACYHQLSENEKAEEYWQRAFYLDPNNEIIQAMGKILEIRN